MPPPGWKPSPAWGPAPEGWQFYVEEVTVDLDDVPALHPVDGTGRDVLADYRGPEGPQRRPWATRYKILTAAGATVLVLAGAALYGDGNPSPPAVVAVDPATPEPGGSSGDVPSVTVPSPTTAASSSRIHPRTTPTSTPAPDPSPASPAPRTTRSAPVTPTAPTDWWTDPTGRTNSAGPGRAPEQGPTSSRRAHGAGGSTGSAARCGAPANPFGYTFCAGKLVTRPARDVCRYFSCTESFWRGHGFLVQCQDGQVSLSGGRRGGCSSHRGVRRPVRRER